MSLIEGELWKPVKFQITAVSLDSSLLLEVVHSKNKTESEKTKFVTEQLNPFLLSNFSNDALKPMFKGVFDEKLKGIGLYRHFFTDALSESIAQGGGFGVSSILQQQLTSSIVLVHLILKTRSQNNSG